ncbi:MAG TPA: hypothetical protein ENH02_07030 [Bacteroidetes bacterium]|nr:hypothetical protein [Bacteroidota bacterium]
MKPNSILNFAAILPPQPRWLMEDSNIFSNNFLIGLKLFTQPYTNGDINSGIILKFGLAF